MSAVARIQFAKDNGTVSLPPESPAQLDTQKYKAFAFESANYFKI